MSIFYRKRKLIIIIVSIIILILSLTIFLLKSKPKKKKEKEVIIENKLERKETKLKELIVDIKGQVKNPGIYTMKEGSRVIDVIEASNGLTSEADTSVINLSKIIEDEMVIIIYSKKEVSDFKKTKEIEKQVEEKCIQKDENALRNDACISNENQEIKGKININTATKEELMTLSGIGESKANDIIKHREKKKFESIDELKEINGIGESLFAKIKENITV